MYLPSKTLFGSLCLTGLSFALLLPGCTNESKFKGKANQDARKTDSDQDIDSQNAGQSGDQKGMPGEEVWGMPPSFSFQLDDTLSSLGKRDIWFVSKAGRVERFSSEKKGTTKEPEKWKSTGTWQLSGGESGHRTYVTEVGLIIGKTGTGAMYRVGDDTAVGSTLHPVWSAPQGQVDSQSRFCLTSFRSKGVAYVGGGYNSSASNRKFVSIPIDKTKPSQLDTSRAEIVDAGQGQWGYSCFTDQGRNIFWSQFINGGQVAGLQLDTKTSLTGANDAPNSGFIAAQLENFRQNIATQSSYAISGDPSGNLLNGVQMYTYAYDPVSKMVFGTDAVGRAITVTRAECFSSKVDCKLNQDHWVWNQTDLGLSIRPLSSLNDGRIVGISRDPAKSGIWLVRLKDPKKPSEAPIAEKIAESDGDGYMYTDFTGGTLYAAEVERTIDLSTAKGFIKGNTVFAIKGKWQAESGEPEEWRGLKLEIRCYTKGVDKKPLYGLISNVPKAGEEFPLDIEMCRNKLFDSVDVRFLPDNAVGGFTKTSSFEVLGVQ